MRRVCEIGLRKKGFHVSVEDDAQRGWERLCSAPYDLLVTDYHMPNLTGVDLIRKMRESKIDVPSLLISGNLPDDSDILCALLKPMKYLPKPFGMDLFISSVEALLNSKVN